MIAAIEVYNKPSFPYRAETFAILAINSWELLFKAKWLADNGNKERSLFIFEPRTNAQGVKSKKQYVKTTRSGNPFTHSADYLGKKLVEQKKLDLRAWENVEALMELRDCAVHFFSNSPAFAVRLQEVGTATLKNFVAVIQEWFDRDLGGFNLYLMPLSFVEVPRDADGILLNAREKNYVTFLESLEKPNAAPNSPYSVTVNIEVKFTRSKAKEALSVQVTKDPSAPAVRLTEEQIRERYPWDYDRLSRECSKRYSDFKMDQQYHALRKRLLADERYGAIRYLDPGNPKSAKKPFFNPNIVAEFDKVYRKG
jgi:hypothetical protein